MQILQILDYTHFFISLNTIDDWIDTPRCHNDSALQYSGQRCTVLTYCWGKDKAWLGDARELVLIESLPWQRKKSSWSWPGQRWVTLSFQEFWKKTQYFWCELYCRSFIGQLVKLSFERYLSLANMWRIFFLQIFRATLFPCCVFSYSLCLCFSRLCGWRLNKWKFIFPLTRPKTVNILP